MIVKKILSYYFIFLSLSCATVVPPTGGDKDTTPPKLLRSIPQNNFTNFKNDKIVFEFDELITLNRFNENFVISPVINVFPKYKIKKNKLYIFFQKNSLDSNITYKISLPNSIADINEGNVLKNIDFSFSTGSFIDTLSFFLIGINSMSNEFVDGLSGILINENKKLKYISYSNEKGRIEFSNLKNGFYNFYCFKDNNKNKVADFKELYYTSNFEINSMNKNIIKKIYLISKNPSDSIPLKVKKTSYINKNCFSVVFNRFLNKEDNIKYSINNSYNKKTNELISTNERDSFIIYHKTVNNENITLNIELNNYLDSFIIPQPKILKVQDLKLTLFSPIITKNNEIFLESNLPIKYINSKNILINGINLKEDVELINNTKIKFKNLLTYPATIIINKGFITDFDDYKDYTDTFNVKLATDDEIGNLSFIIKDSTKQCSGHLLIKVFNNNYNYDIVSIPEKLIKIKSLLPGNYNIQIILDNNNNGNREENERIIKLNNFFNIKENWELENVNININ
ncbi:MAG: Ig-like domain-containing protein [Bacteroidetes bacterium]|nr:Ig-like domain-containing protein [Bacteroidota bacterium]